MSNLQEVSGSLPKWVQDCIQKAGNSTCRDHLDPKHRRLKKASMKHPYGVFDPNFPNISATNDVFGISAVNRPACADYPERTDVLIQYEDYIADIYTNPVGFSAQPTDLCRIKESPKGDTHAYPTLSSYIRPYESVTKLWSANEEGKLKHEDLKNDA